MSKADTLKAITELLKQDSDKQEIKEQLIKTVIDYTNDGGILLVPVHEDKEGTLPVLFTDAEGRPYLQAYTDKDEYMESEEHADGVKTVEMSVDALTKHVLLRSDLYGLYLNLYGDAGSFSRLDLWRVLEDNESLPADSQFRNQMIERAITFALEVHGGQVRKGSYDPFITHPLEVLSILNSMNLISVDPNIVIAGILHDVVEDTPVEIYEIAWYFGHDVAMLVESHTEDKTKDWQQRKEQDIADLREANIRTKSLVMADLLANLRSMCRDYMQIHEELWNRFKAPKEKQSWYYNGMIEALEEMADYNEAAPVYWELKERYEQLFSGSQD